MTVLPDVNVLLALVWSNHPHHESAHDWFRRDATLGWATCLLTQSAFVRLSLNPMIVGATIDCMTAFQLLDTLTRHPDHQFVDTLPSLSNQSFVDLIPKILGYRQISDATLMHLARSNNLKVVTFDRSIAGICPWQENLLVLSLPQATS